MLAVFVGFEVISKVPTTLHTPLMSATNAIHGIVLVGAMLIAVSAHNAVGYVLAFIAAFFAGANVVGRVRIAEARIRSASVSIGASSTSSP